MTAQPAALGACLPPALRALARFLPWRAQLRASGKLGKVPLRRRGSRLYPTRADDPLAWLTFGDALLELERGQADGVGLCNPDGLAVLDLDGVLSADAAQRLAEQPTWTECSPSGQGLHLWYTCPPGTPSACTEGWELLCAGRFVTLTGEQVRGTPHSLAELPAAYRASRPAPRSIRLVDLTDLAAAPTGSTLPDPPGPRTQLWQLHVAGDASGYTSASEADLALCQLWIQRVGPDAALIDGLVRQSALYRAKWENENYLTRIIERAINSRNRYR